MNNLNNKISAGTIARTACLLLALVLTVVVVYDALVLLWYNPEPMKSVAALLVLCILAVLWLGYSCMMPQLLFSARGTMIFVPDPPLRR